MRQIPSSPITLGRSHRTLTLGFRFEHTGGEQLPLLRLDVSLGECELAQELLPPGLELRYLPIGISEVARYSRGLGKLPRPLDPRHLAGNHQPPAFSIRIA